MVNVDSGIIQNNVGGVLPQGPGEYVSHNPAIIAKPFGRKRGYSLSRTALACHVQVTCDIHR